jgi:Holliday junction resolvase-like predicted endonuclease
MTLLERFQSWRGKKPPSLSSRYGALGERAAKKHLQKAGLKFLTANSRTRRGELDLVFRDADCLLFISFARNAFRTFKLLTGSRRQSQYSGISKRGHFYLAIVHYL